MRIKKELQKLAELKEVIVTNNVIGQTDGEAHKYLVYNNSNYNFRFGANTQNEIIERLS